MIRSFGFDETEYQRVRNWLLTALELTPDYFSEAEILTNLRSEKPWFLITTEHAGCVFEVYSIDGERVANVLLIGGEKGKALREIIGAQRYVCEWLRTEGFTKIVGTPRKEFHKILKANGFEQEQEELILRLK